MGNSLSILKTYEVIRAQLEAGLDEWRASNIHDLLPGTPSDIVIVCEPSLMEEEAAHDLQLKESRKVLCDVSNSSLGRLPEIMKKLSVMQGETGYNLQLDEEEEWHDALCDVSSLDRLEQIVNEQSKTERETEDNQEKEEWHDTFCNVSDSLSITLSETSNEQSMMEIKAADHVQIREKGEMDDTLCNVSDSLSDTHIDNVNEHSMTERRVDEYLQIRGEEEMSDALRHSSNSLSGRLLEKEIVEEQSMMEKQIAGPLKLKDKGEEFSDKSFDEFPAQSSRILQLDHTIETDDAVDFQQKDKDKVSNNTSLIQDVATSRSEFKKDKDKVSISTSLTQDVASNTREFNNDQSGNVIVTERSTMEKQTADTLKLKDKMEESHERPPIVPNVSPEKSDSIIPSDPNIEGRAAEELQLTNTDGDFCDRSHHISHGKSASILSRGPNTESDAVDHVQLIDTDKESCDRSLNVPKVSPGKPNNILPYGHALRKGAVEELQLKNKDGESHHTSPTVPNVSPGKSGNILHSDPNFSTAESLQNSQFTQSAAPSTNKLKEDPVQCIQEPRSLQNGSKLKPKVEVYMPQVKNRVSSSTTAVVKINGLEDRSKPAVDYNIPSGSGEILKIKSEPGFIESSSADKLIDPESPPCVTNKFQLNPNACEFFPRLKNLPPLVSESAENLKHTHATTDNNTTPPDGDLTLPKSATGDFTQENDEIESFPDQGATQSNNQSQPTANCVVLPDVITSNRISVFDPLTIDTSFGYVQEDLFYYHARGLAYRSDVPNSDAAVDASQEMTNVHSTTASTSVQSDYQLLSNNLNPLNSKFCLTPGCRSHVDGRCNGPPVTAQSDIEATVSDTLQEYLGCLAFPDSSEVHSATQQANAGSDLPRSVTRDRRTERQAPKWNVNDSNFSIDLQKTVIDNNMVIEDLYTTICAQSGNNVELKLQMAEVKKWVVISKIDLKMMEANHEVNVLYSVPSTMTKGDVDSMNDSLYLYTVNCTIMKHNVEVLVKSIQLKLKQGEDVDWSTIDLQASSFHCFQPSCY